MSSNNLLQQFSKVMDQVKTKASELKEEVVEALRVDPAPSSSGPPQQHQQQQQTQQQEATAAAEAPVADSRATSIHLCGFDIEGVSIAGQETCIILPRLKVAFDFGRCPQRAVFQQSVLLSHGHLDHIGGAPFHASSRGLLGLPPARYIVPPSCADKLRSLLSAAEACQDNGAPLEYDVAPLAPGEEVELPTGHLVRPFATTHTVASQGYILYSYRKRLKAELVGRPPEAIKELRAAGQEVTDTYQIPEVAFTGDTSGALFESPDCPADLFRARLLIVELSFVEEEGVSWSQARERGHMHVTDLVMHAHKFHNEAILLIHFSARYKRAEILAALDANMPASLRQKCVPFLNGFP